MARSGTRVVIKRGALYDLRREPGVRADCERRARAVLNAAGGEHMGYMMSSTQGAKKPQGRWRAAVFTSNFKAIKDNAQHNTLLRSLGAARG